MKILIHCGHKNIKNNCDAGLRSGTGAPGEAEFNWKVGIALEKLLQEDGHSTYLDDANTNCKKEVTKQDWDLAFAIHADANIYGTGGGFVDVLRPDWDPARVESARIAQAIRDRYFPETGIVNHPERSNKNTSEYYLWNYLTDSTPCVIIECGVLLDAHDSVILNDTQRVAKGIREGIRKAFGTVVTPPTPEPPTDPCANLRDEVDNLKRTLGLTEQDNKTKQAMIDDLKSNLIASNSKIKPLEERNKKLEAYVQGIKELILKV